MPALVTETVTFLPTSRVPVSYTELLAYYEIAKSRGHAKMIRSYDREEQGEGPRDESGASEMRLLEALEPLWRSRETYRVRIRKKVWRDAAERLV
jgi:hypothetical protein